MSPPAFSEAFKLSCLANDPQNSIWFSMLITILLKLHAATSGNNCALEVDQPFRIEHPPDSPSQEREIL